MLSNVIKTKRKSIKRLRECLFIRPAQICGLLILGRSSWYTQNRSSWTGVIGLEPLVLSTVAVYISPGWGGVVRRGGRN